MRDVLKTCLQRAMPNALPKKVLKLLKKARKTIDKTGTALIHESKFSEHQEMVKVWLQSQGLTYTILGAPLASRPDILLKIWFVSRAPEIPIILQGCIDILYQEARKGETQAYIHIEDETHIQGVIAWFKSQDLRIQCKGPNGFEVSWGL